jgi:hypothetical protein
MPDGKLCESVGDLPHPAVILLRLLIDKQQQRELNPLYNLGRVLQQFTTSNSS